MKHHIHQSAKGSRDIGEAKGHDKKFKSHMCLVTHIVLDSSPSGIFW